MVPPRIDPSHDNAARPVSPVPLSKCRQCSTSLDGMHDRCLTCGADIGAPNRRECLGREEIEALIDREVATRTEISSRGLHDCYDSFVKTVDDLSTVVVSIPEVNALGFFNDPNALYSNYEQMVGAEVRAPAKTLDDRHRCAVGGVLFGTYAKEIHYGVLSLNGRGLQTYGGLHLRLKEIAVKSRTTFLEANSYDFVSRESLQPGQKIPLGHRATWENRAKLAGSKLGPAITESTQPDDFPGMLIASDGIDRHNDEFIEAHIFGPFSQNAVEEVHAADPANVGELAQIVLKLFETRAQGKLVAAS